MVALVKLLIYVFLVSFSIHAHAEEKKVICQSESGHYGNNYYGPTYCSEGTVDSIQVFGELTMQEVKIQGDLNAYGKTRLEDVEITGNSVIAGALTMQDSIIAGNLEAKGMVQLENAIVEGEATIFGLLKARDSAFENVLTLFAEKVELNDTTVRALVLEAIKPAKPQLVKLEEDSLVEGDIVFKSNDYPGKVKCSNDSRVEGSVINGSAIGCN